jgi:hypothetical protein
MIYHDKVFSSYKGTITVLHDSFVKFLTEIRDYSNNTIATKEFNLVALNPLSQGKLFINKSSLEF